MHMYTGTHTHALMFCVWVVHSLVVQAWSHRTDTGLLCCSQVVEEGGAGMAKTIALGRRLPFGAAAPAHVARPPPPALHQLFARTAPQVESSGEIARITDDEEADTAQADFPNQPGASPARPSWGSRPQEMASKSPQNAFSSLSGGLSTISPCEIRWSASTVKALACPTQALKQSLCIAQSRVALKLHRTGLEVGLQPSLCTG